MTWQQPKRPELGLRVNDGSLKDSFSKHTKIPLSDRNKAGLGRTRKSPPPT